MNALIGVVCVLIIIILCTIYNARVQECSTLQGFWEGCPEFCIESELTMFYIYIGKETSNGYTGYIFMENESGIIINNPVIFKIDNSLSLSPSIRDKIIRKIHINWMDDPGYDFFPIDQTLILNTLNGKMLLESNGVVNAIMYKNHSCTDEGIDNEISHDSQDSYDTIALNEDSEDI